MTLAWQPELRRDAQLAASLLARRESIEPDVAIAVACRHFGVRLGDLKSHRRRQSLVWARAFVVWVLRTVGEPMPYPAIGERLRRTHSAAINLHMVAIRLRLSEPAFAAACRGVVDHVFRDEEVLHACH